MLFFLKVVIKSLFNRFVDLFLNFLVLDLIFEVNAGLSVHLDSTYEEIGTLQHKFRYVLNGNIDKLYFLDKNHNKIFVPDCYDTYIMDGSHAHSLDPGTEEKITLCIGAPWKGKPNEKYNALLNDSLYKFKVSRPSYYEQEWLDPFFKK